MTTDRKLWLDTRGVPVITISPNGERNARRWGWTPVVASAVSEGDIARIVENVIEGDWLVQDLVDALWAEVSGENRRREDAAVAAFKTAWSEIPIRSLLAYRESSPPLRQCRASGPMPPTSSGRRLTMPEPEGIIADAESRSYWNLQAISARAVGDTKRERHALDMLILMGDDDE